MEPTKESIKQKTEYEGMDEMILTLKKHKPSGPVKRQLEHSRYVFMRSD